MAVATTGPRPPTRRSTAPDDRRATSVGPSSVRRGRSVVAAWRIAGKRRRPGSRAGAGGVASRRATPRPRRTAPRPARRRVQRRHVPRARSTSRSSTLANSGDTASRADAISSSAPHVVAIGLTVVDGVELGARSDRRPSRAPGCGSRPELSNASPIGTITVSGAVAAARARCARRRCGRGRGSPRSPVVPSGKIATIAPVAELPVARLEHPTVVVRRSPSDSR